MYCYQKRFIGWGSFLIFIFIFLLNNISFSQSKWIVLKHTVNEKELITLIISHDDCSTCLDGQIEKGSITWPDSLTNRNYKIPEVPTIVFSDKSLEMILFGKHGSADFNKMYMVMGKIVRCYNSPKAGTFVPIIEVYQYRFLKEKEIQ